MDDTPLHCVASTFQKTVNVTLNETFEFDGVLFTTHDGALKIEYISFIVMQSLTSLISITGTAEAYLTDIDINSSHTYVMSGSLLDINEGYLFISGFTLDSIRLASHPLISCPMTSHLQCSTSPLINHVTREEGNGSLFEFTSFDGNLTIGPLYSITDIECTNGYGGIIYANVSDGMRLNTFFYLCPHHQCSVHH